MKPIKDIKLYCQDKIWILSYMIDGNLRNIDLESPNRMIAVKKAVGHLNELHRLRTIKWLEQPEDNEFPAGSVSETMNILDAKEAMEESSKEDIIKVNK